MRTVAAAVFLPQVPKGFSAPCSDRSLHASGVTKMLEVGDSSFLLRDFVVAPSSAIEYFSLEHNFLGTEERATLKRYHDFHGHSGMRT